MPKTPSQQAHPSGDPRFEALERTMKRLGYESDALLEVLNVAQEVFGYLSEDLLVYVSNRLHVPLSVVYGVATFYHLFTFTPRGKHNCIICTGTACHVKGSAAITETLSETFDMPIGGTTEDGLLSITTARCLGSCGLAPVTVLDGQVHGKATAESITQRIMELLQKEPEYSPATEGP
jgi:bidirectional [NiFe] hydrogenase diaphorase subunit